MHDPSSKFSAIAMHKIDAKSVELSALWNKDVTGRSDFVIASTVLQKFARYTSDK